MDFYPGEFSSEARDRIDKEKILAYQEMVPRSVYDSAEEDLAIACIMRIFLAFAREACALRKDERGWTIDRIEHESQDFLDRLASDVVRDKFPGLDRRWFRDGYLASTVMRRFREWAEWKEYEELLLATPIANADALIANPESPENPPAANHQRAVINAFISNLMNAGQRITRQDIWIVAGYNDATEFQRFQRGDTRTTSTALANFDRVLNMSPEQFIQALEKKKPMVLEKLKRKE
jgi:hypothetical protein